jgi:flagellar biosynthesis protein FliP
MGRSDDIRSFVTHSDATKIGRRVRCADQWIGEIVLMKLVRTADPTSCRRSSVKTALLLLLALILIPQTLLAQATSRTPGGIVRPAVERQIPPVQPPRLIPPLAENPNGLANPLGVDVGQMTSPQGLTGSLKVMVLLTVLSLAPSILMMTTCFIRFVVVLGLLRQALGTQQLPPNQVLISLALFLTFMVMGPIWNKGYQQGVRPYTSPGPGESQIDEMTAFNRAVAPVREFMAEQIDQAGNSEVVWMFVDFQRPVEGTPEAANWQDPETYEDVSLLALAPAYMLSELKVAFLIGFQIYLPFIVIDMVISSVLISMGMMMLPPVLVSLPFKLLLFVLIDGWFLTVGMLLESVRPLSG